MNWYKGRDCGPPSGLQARRAQGTSARETVGLQARRAQGTSASKTSGPEIGAKAPRGISEGPVGGEKQRVSAVRQETDVKGSLFMTVGVRALSLGDAPWLAAMHAQGFASPWSPTSFAQVLSLPTSQGWVAQAVDVPAGFILGQVQPEEAEILTFQVAPCYQGQGYGHRLLGHLLTQCRRQGVAQVFLDVAESSRAAQHLYSSHGFVFTRRRKGYYRARQGREDALCFVKHLEPAS